MTGTLDHDATDFPGLRLAPYVLARLAALPYPDPPAGAGRFRQLLERVSQLEEQIEAIADRLADALHDSATGHQLDFHRKVVLPLRRDVHNRRLPRKARLATLGDLPARVAGLAGWLDAAAELADLREQLRDAYPQALAAERTVVAELCRAEPLRRAVTLVGTDLLYGVDRQATAAPDLDARARKAEPNILRYVLRASAKTSPLSWFTYVALGEWEPDGDVPPPGGDARAATQVNRTILTAITNAILALPRLRPAVRYRLAPAIAVAGVVSFRRDQPVNTVDRLAAVREERVELKPTGPLRLLIELVRAAGAEGARLGDLATTLAARLPGDPEQARATARRYVEQIREQGVLVPVYPYHPQDPEAVATLADWLERHGEQPLAAELRVADRDTRRFATLPAGARAQALHELRQRWSAIAATVRVEPPGGTEVLTEDVCLPAPVRLARRHGRDAAGDLPGLAALAELFDFQVLVRRLIRDRFIARYGVGGECRQVADFSVEVSQAWLDSTLVSPDGTIRGGSSAVTEEVRELARIRATITAQVRAAASAGSDEVEIPEPVVRQALAMLPAWAGARPSSYCFFAQPSPARDRTTLVVNHIYSGWGKFASRFLDLLPASAAAAVGAQLRHYLGPAARIGQFRPVAGFNANLHPMLVGDEVAEDPKWGSIRTADIWLRHDPATDQVRLWHSQTGEPLDVLYLGLLIPLALPDRLSPIYSDLGGGPVTLTPLVAEQDRDGVRFRPRLRFRDIVVSRRRWLLPAERVAPVRAELAATAPESVAEVVARWRAGLGLPAHVFVRPPERGDSPSLDALREYFYQPKPQYADLHNALHLRCLPRLLDRHQDGVCVEEALPVPGRDCPDGRVLELMLETYRKGRA